MQYALMTLRFTSSSASITSESTIGINTYRDEVSSQSIKDYYNNAIKILNAKNLKTETYIWVEPMSRVSTFIQNSTGYIEVSVSSGNDSESVYISYSPGQLNDSNAELLSSNELPMHFLRCDQK